MPFEIASLLQCIANREWLQTSKNGLLGSDNLLGKLAATCYMWQSRVEIEQCQDGAHTHCVNVFNIHEFTQQV